MKFTKIAITGGKGGTGKSTFSILLANKLRAEGHRIMLADCDVECPNDHLLTSQKLKSVGQKVYALFPYLDKSKCVKCGKCVKECRANAIFQPPDKYPVFLHELCSGCGLCWHICPRQAIKPKKKLIGKIFKNKVNQSFYLITAQSVGIVDETGPIVTALRKYIDKQQKQVKADYLLLDTAVGLHCGVIRALIDVDLAYAVTEPTPLGAHDLEQILKLNQKLKVPTKVVINQADLGDKKLITPLLKKYHTTIAYQIPYNKSLAQSYAKGNLDKINIL